MDWIQLYVEYAKNNEAPEYFHWWTGMTILGAALRCNVSFVQGYSEIYPNLWTLIIAPSGVGKTSAVKIGYNIITKLDSVRIMADKFTPEALAKNLSKKDEITNTVESQGLIYAPEFVVMMDKRQHYEGLVSFLLRAHDCPENWVYETKNAEPIRLRNVALSILGATAPELLYESVPAAALKTGFMARFLCIPWAGGSTPTPFPWRDTMLENQVLQGLYEISLLSGKVVMPSKAQQWYINWYLQYKAHLGITGGGRLRAYLERKPAYLLQLAMLIGISRSRCLEYTITAFEEALKKLEELEPGLEEIYREVDATPLGKDSMTILSQIKAAGGKLSHEELAHRNYALMRDTASLKKIMTNLVETGLIGLARGREGLIYVFKDRKGNK